MGFTYQMLQFQEERLACAALSMTPMDTVIAETVEYLRQRKAFGQPLLNNQYIHFKLAELMTEVEMLRAGLYRATDQHVAGEDVTQLASMCKLKCGGWSGRWRTRVSSTGEGWDSPTRFLSVAST